MGINILFLFGNRLVVASFPVDWEKDVALIKSLWDHEVERTAMDPRV